MEVTVVVLSSGSRIYIERLRLSDVLRINCKARLSGAAINYAVPIVVTKPTDT